MLRFNKSGRSKIFLVGDDRQLWNGVTYKSVLDYILNYIVSVFHICLSLLKNADYKEVKSYAWQVSESRAKLRLNAYKHVQLANLSPNMREWMCYTKCPGYASR